MIFQRARSASGMGNAPTDRWGERFKNYDEIIDTKKTTMKRLALILLMCLPALIQAQTFSKRADDDLFSVYMSVLNQSFGYQTIGVRIDTNEMYHFNTIIRNFNFTGEIIDTKEYYFSNKQLSPPRDNNARLNDSIVVTAMMEADYNNDIIYSTVVWLNNEGDTLLTKRFNSPYFTSSNAQTILNYPRCIICSPDGQYIYFASQIFHSSNENNFMIRKLTAQGEEVWSYIDPLDFWYQSCDVLYFYEGQVWFVKPSGGVPQGHYNKLMRLNDNTGIVDYSVEHDATGFSIGGATDMLMDSEGYCATTSTYTTLTSLTPSIFKVNFSGELLWHAQPNIDGAQMQQSEHLLRANDNGYVACSVKWEEQSNPFDPNEISSNNTNRKICLWKVDENGVFQWQRFYEYLSFDSGYLFLNNQVHDFKSTPDGGYIMAGESTSLCLNWPSCSEDSQQGWLLKVDGCGCLVPGCDQNCVVTNLGNEQEVRVNYFLFGPNPVDELLNVYVPTLPIPIKDLTFRLFDMQGKLLREFQFESDNTTYMIDVNSLASGNYILSAFYKGEVVESEKVVKK